MSMSRRHWLLFATSVIALSLLTGAIPSSAQPFWIPRDGKQAVMLEFLRPSFEGVDAEFYSGAVFASARLAVSSHFAIVGEVPYAHHESNFDLFGGGSTTESGNTIGNIYLGLETIPGSSPFFAEFGVRAPLASEDEFLAGLTGTFSDVTRWEAFLPNFLSIHAAVNLHEVSRSNIEYRLRFCPAVVIPTEDGASDDTELFAIYAWEVGYRGRYVRIGTALSGRVLITEDFSNLGERSLNQFELHGDFGPWSIRPGLELRLPLDSWSDLVPVVLGASVSWHSAQP